MLYSSNGEGLGQKGKELFGRRKEYRMSGGTVFELDLMTRVNVVVCGVNLCVHALHHLTGRVLFALI